MRYAVWILVEKLACKLLLFVLFAAAAFSQDASPQSAQPPAQNQPAVQAKPPANAEGQSRDKSVIKPKPGGEVIKPQDYSDSTGYWHPFSREAKYIVHDQKNIWTSPFHTARKQAKYWLLFGAATGALIAADRYFSSQVPHSGTVNSVGTDVSYLGEAYTLLPIGAGMYFGGTAAHTTW